MSKKLSIVVPALNEEITIGTFVDWCKEGLREAKIDGEILIIDSSTDRTPEIAKEHGATVIRTPKRGLGQAYIDALPYISGDYVIMGDCDCTYDFRVLSPFVKKLDEGYDYVMGTRMKGTIEKGAMPPSHQYFGTPLTTWLLNVIYGSHFSDIHCGMRAMTKEALLKLNLESPSWEYASEMVLKAEKLMLKCTEVPIVFHKDMEGRQSMMIRNGSFESWRAGWVNLKVMFSYSPRFFLQLPGCFFLCLGLILSIILLPGPIDIGGIMLTTHWMILGVTFVTIGITALQMSALSEMVYEFDKDNTERLKRIITYNRGFIVSAITGLSGFVILLKFLVDYIRSGQVTVNASHMGIFGLMLLIITFQIFTFTLVFHMMAHKNECAKKKESFQRHIQQINMEENV